MPAVRPLSLRWRLLAATFVAATVAVALAGWFLSGLFRDHVTRQFASALTAQLDQVTARLEFDSQGRPALNPATLSDPRWSRPYSGLYWQVDSIQGDALRHGVLRSRSLWDAELAAPNDFIADGQVHLHEVLGPGGNDVLMVERVVRFDAGIAIPWRVLVAGDLQEIAVAASRFNGVLAASLAVLLCLLMVAAAAQVSVGLLPLRALQRALAAVHDARAQRLEGRFPAEIQPLIDDFNSVLARNAEFVARARTQAGNLAHAIKTPLAAMAQAATAARPRTEALADLPRVVDEQVAAAQRHIDWHLARARAAAAVGLPGIRTEVAPIVAGLVRVMARVHAERNLRIHTDDVDPSLVFAGEAQDLQEMLGNVLDNACKWARSAVRVAAVRSGDDAARYFTVSVEDDGPGISAEQCCQAITRGARLDESVPGSGLGLAIVDELVGLYRGAMQLVERPQGGLRVELQLPAAGKYTT